MDLENILLRQGIKLVKAGEQNQAKEMLMQVLSINTNNESAWLWLSGVMDKDPERRICLENTIRINPNNQAAARGLEIINSRMNGRETSLTPDSEIQLPPEFFSNNVAQAPLNELQSLMKNLIEEIRWLRSDFSSIYLPIQPDHIIEEKLSEEKVDQDPIDLPSIGEEETIAKRWLENQRIILKSFKVKEPADAVYDKLANYLGNHYDTIIKLHDNIRRSIARGNRLQLSLANTSQEEIAKSTQFCSLLHQLAILTDYRYDKNTRTIHAIMQRSGDVINFFNGEWFERYVSLKVTSTFRSHNTKFTLFQNLLIQLDNGDDFELDMLFFYNDIPLWLECKTGNYQHYITRYSAMRKKLGIPKNKSFLIMLGLSEELAAQLTNLQDIQVVNQKTFIDGIVRSLSTSPGKLKGAANSDQPEVAKPGMNGTAQVVARLNKNNLRPLPDIRPKVIKGLISYFSKMAHPVLLSELKSFLAEKEGISKSMVQEILNAIIRRGGFIDEQGEVMQSFNAPIAGLASNSFEEAERKCMESYAYVFLKHDLDYFEDDQNVAIFERAVDGKIPPSTLLEKIREQIIMENGDKDDLEKPEVKEN